MSILVDKDTRLVVQGITGFLSAYFMEKPGFNLQRHFDDFFKLTTKKLATKPARLFLCLYIGEMVHGSQGEMRDPNGRQLAWYNRAMVSLHRGVDTTQGITGPRLALEPQWWIRV